MVDVPTALAVLDWRRRTHALYAEVRAALDPAAGHELWRRGRDLLYATHPASPLLPEARADFAGLPVPAYDPAYRFEVAVEPTEPEPWEYETGTDGVVSFAQLGTVTLGDLGTLAVWAIEGYGNGVFVPLKDAGAGRPGGSYGGGRYVLDTIKGADLGDHDGRLVVDLNFAYAPSCAHDPAWACPLAPAGNVLAADVPVGELTG